MRIGLIDAMLTPARVLLAMILYRGDNGAAGAVRSTGPKVPTMEGSAR